MHLRWWGFPGSGCTKKGSRESAADYSGVLAIITRPWLLLPRVGGKGNDEGGSVRLDNECTDFVLLGLGRV